MGTQKHRAERQEESRMGLGHGVQASREFSKWRDRLAELLVESRLEL